MPIKMFYAGFGIGYSIENSDTLSKFFSNPEDKIVDNINDSNVLVIGSFVQQHEVQLIFFYKGIKILFITEPIGKLQYLLLAGQIYQNDLSNYYIGCVTNKPNKCIKYSIFWDYNANFNSINEYVSTCSLEGKQFCTLISRHDPGNTRIHIARELSKISNIVCPGNLFNNCSNEELNRIHPPEFIKKFVFNICGENFGSSHPGYITEKLWNCVLGGAIPIYFGKLDDVDEKIFNSKRILFLNENNTVEIAQRVLEMVKNPHLLESFYRQPVFMDTAKEAMQGMLEGMRAFFKGVSESV